MSGACITDGGDKICIQIFFCRKPEEMRSLGVLNRKFEDNIKMGLKEIECQDVATLICLMIGANGWPL
jgi:hypothetical protein